jgi:NADH-quinone oxidoreductase subunit G
MAWVNGFPPVPLLATIEMFKGPAMEGAKYVLPAAAFAEKEGSFVNHAGLAQWIKRASRPPGECRTEGQVFFDLLGRRGLAQMAEIRNEMAAEVAYFAPLGRGIAELGTMLA